MVVVVVDVEVVVVVVVDVVVDEMTGVVVEVTVLETEVKSSLTIFAVSYTHLTLPTMDSV